VRRRNPLIWLDLLLLGISYVIVVALKSWGPSYFTDKYLAGIGVMAAIWLGTTMLFRKFNPKKPPSNSVSLHIIFVNILIFGVIAIAMYGARSMEYSRMIVFGTIALATFFEIITSKVYRLVVQANGNYNSNGVLVAKRKKNKIASSNKLS